MFSKTETTSPHAPTQIISILTVKEPEHFALLSRHILQHFVFVSTSFFSAPCPAHTAPYTKPEVQPKQTLLRRSSAPPFRPEEPCIIHSEKFRSSIFYKPTMFFSQLSFWLWDESYRKFQPDTGNPDGYRFAWY